MKLVILAILGIFLNIGQASALEQEFSMPNWEAMSGDSNSIEWLRNQVSSYFAEAGLTEAEPNGKADLMILIAKTGAAGGIYYDLKEFNFKVSIKTGVHKKYYRWETGNPIAIENNANNLLLAFNCKGKLGLLRKKKHLHAEVMKCLDMNLNSSIVSEIQTQAMNLILSEF
jgi:hypothetical protein